MAGHWHYYESLYPQEHGTTGAGGKVTQRNFVDPKVPVHITTGNGGPPSADSFHEDCGAGSTDCNSIPATRFQSTLYGYGRLTAHNRTHLQYEQIINSNGSVIDSWVLVRSQ